MTQHEINKELVALIGLTIDGLDRLAKQRLDLSSLQDQVMRLADAVGDRPDDTTNSPLSVLQVGVIPLPHASLCLAGITTGGGCATSNQSCRQSGGDQNKLIVSENKKGPSIAEAR